LIRKEVRAVCDESGGIKRVRKRWWRGEGGGELMKKGAARINFRNNKWQIAFCFGGARRCAALGEF